MDDKDVLELLNRDLNELNVKIGVSKLQIKTKGGALARQKLKESIMEAQSNFVKEIERLYY